MRHFATVKAPPWPPSTQSALGLSSPASAHLSLRWETPAYDVRPGTTPSSHRGVLTPTSAQPSLQAAVIEVCRRALLPFYCSNPRVATHLYLEVYIAGVCVCAVIACYPVHSLHLVLALVGVCLRSFPSLPVLLSPPRPSLSPSPPSAMGVPKFYRWLSERYPLINQAVTSTTRAECDNLYLDMNGIVHNCTHGDDDALRLHLSEAQIFTNIFKYLDKGQRGFPLHPSLTTPLHCSLHSPSPLSLSRCVLQCLTFTHTSHSHTHSLPSPPSLCTTDELTLFAVLGCTLLLLCEAVQAGAAAPSAVHGAGRGGPSCEDESAEAAAVPLSR